MQKRRGWLLKPIIALLPLLWDVKEDYNVLHLRLRHAEPVACRGDGRKRSLSLLDRNGLDTLRHETQTYA